MNFSKEKEVALEAAMKAGKSLLKYFGRKGMVRQKQNRTFVGIADLEAEKIIVKAISENFPEHSITTEESGTKRKNSDYRWIIDPLDGTHNFLFGLPFFGTSIALAYKNEVVVGVIHFPIFKETIVAVKGNGAFLNGKRIKIKSNNETGRLSVIFEFTRENRALKIKYLEKMIDEYVDLRNFGSAIYHLALLVKGNMDGYVNYHTFEWDAAAGLLAVQEAGGKVTSIDGGKWDISQDKFIASNGKVHGKLLHYGRASLI